MPGRGRGSRSAARSAGTGCWLPGLPSPIPALGSFGRADPASRVGAGWPGPRRAGRGHLILASPPAPDGHLKPRASLLSVSVVIRPLPGCVHVQMCPFLKGSPHAGRRPPCSSTSSSQSRVQKGPFGDPRAGLECVSGRHPHPWGCLTPLLGLSTCCPVSQPGHGPPCCSLPLPHPTPPLHLGQASTPPAHGPPCCPLPPPHPSTWARPLPLL